MTRWSFEGESAASRPPPPPGIVLGQYLGGDFALPVNDDGLAVWPFEDFNRHLVILGKTGKGKTSTAWTVFDGTSRANPDAQIFVIDGNADPEMAKTFGASMVATGRDPLIFPQERFNAWPGGDWRPIYNRLLQVIPFAETEAAAYYTDSATVVLQLACRLSGIPPASTEELFDRLDYEVLMDAYGPRELKGIKPEHVEAVYMRCKSVCAHFGSALDGERTFADLDAAYFGLDALVLGKSAVVTMRMLLSQLEYYIEHEKPRDRLCVVIIDEFASLAKGVNVSTFVEHARKLGVCVILMSQTVPGMGDPVQIARVLHNSGLLIVHSTPEWLEILSLIGTEIKPEMTLREENDLGADLDMLRLVEKPKVTRDELLALPVGHVWAFRDNCAMRLSISLPDAGGYEPFMLPEPEALFESLSDAWKTGVHVDRPPMWLGGQRRKGSFHGAEFEIPDEDAGEPADGSVSQPTAGMAAPPDADGAGAQPPDGANAESSDGADATSPDGEDAVPSDDADATSTQGADAAPPDDTVTEEVNDD